MITSKEAAIVLTPDSPTELSQMTPSQIDALPFGAIKISRDGTILSYNNYEAKLTGRNPEKVIGRNFFTDVAPCAAVQEFYGRFQEMLQTKAVYKDFDFEFALQPPLKVKIRVLFEHNAGVGWILVKEL